MGLFSKAVKHSAKLRLAIIGPSGSGKTYSALAIATALAPGKVAVIDTESGSASKYADTFEFDVAELEAPFHPQKYINAIQQAAAAGYEVVILDSVSHAWAGAGGVLEIVDEAAKRMKTTNTYVAWKEGTKVQNELTEAIVRAGIHVIATMRSKQDYVQERDSNGRTVIRKVGMAPVAREGSEYEYDVLLEMNMENEAIVSKTRCPEMTGKVYSKPGAQVAKILKEWLGGAPAPERKTVQPEEDFGMGDNEESSTEEKTKLPVLSEAQLRELHIVGREFYGDEWDEQRPKLVQAVSKGAVTSSKELMPEEADKLIKGIKKKAASLAQQAQPAQVAA